MADKNKCRYCTPDADDYMTPLPTPKYAKNMTIFGGIGHREWHIDGGRVNGMQIRLDINFCPMCGKQLRQDPHMIDYKES